MVPSFHNTDKPTAVIKADRLVRTAGGALNDPAICCLAIGDKSRWR
jgi:hypothetical protein